MNKFVFFLDTLSLLQKTAGSYEGSPAHSGDNIHASSFEILITTNLHYGDFFALAVDRNDSIEKVETKIEEKFKIPPDKQSLFFVGVLLEGDHALSDYNIQNGSMLRLISVCEIVIEIGVRTLTGDMITLAVKPTDRIEEVKGQIERKEGIPSDQQRLVFGDRILHDEFLLRGCRINYRSIVHMAMQIFIKPLSGKKIALNVLPSDTVEMLKRKREKVKRFPRGETPTLAYDGRRLDDNATLAHCSVHMSSTLCEVNINGTFVVHYFFSVRIV